MKRDEALLLDILLAARDACDFVNGMSWQQFSASRLHQNAVIRSLEIVGEASSKISPAFREAHPKMPWSEMIGMRNRLIHDYGGVRLDVVWDVVTQHLSVLIKTIEPLIPPPPPPGHLGGGSKRPESAGKGSSAQEASSRSAKPRSHSRPAKTKDGWEL